MQHDLFGCQSIGCTADRSCDISERGQHEAEKESNINPWMISNTRIHFSQVDLLSWIIAYARIHFP